MKIIFKSAILAALVLSSCAKDETKTDNNSEEQTELAESTPLEANSVSDNVIIEGGTLKEGTPPTPNGEISLDLSDVDETALLREGFQVPLDSDAEITGAYIQFKANDGTIADDYYDINLEANNTSEGGKTFKRKGFSQNKLNVSGKTDENELDVDFNANIEPGEFCYLVCVYDTEGNISLPQEVCVTVEAWGGTSDLVAEWELTKQSETYNGTESTSLIGEEDCSEASTFDCIQGGQFMAAYSCDTIDSFVIEFNEDGTYQFESNDSEKNLDTNSSYDACEPIYETGQGNYSSEGQWAYVADDNRLILVEYSFSEGYQDETYTYTNEPGEADLLLDGLVEFDGATMIIIAEGDDYIDKFFFQK